MPYWGMLLLILVNAILISLMEITINDDQAEGSQPKSSTKTMN